MVWLEFLGFWLFSVDMRGYCCFRLVGFGLALIAFWLLVWVRAWLVVCGGCGSVGLGCVVIMWGGFWLWCCCWLIVVLLRSATFWVNCVLLGGLGNMGFWVWVAVVVLV